MTRRQENKKARRKDGKKIKWHKNKTNKIARKTITA